MLTAMPYLRQLAALGSLSALSAALMRSLDTVAQPPATQAADELASQTFLITGSTEGIGRHTAQLLAQAHATVLLHGRWVRRQRAAAAAVRRSTAAKPRLALQGGACGAAGDPRPAASDVQPAGVRLCI